MHVGGISEQMYEIYQYGFQMGLELIVCFITSLAIAVYLHMLLEFTIFSIIFILLRTYVGGFHMESFLGCYLCSAAVQTIALLFFKHYEFSLITAWIIIIICSCIILLKAPFESAKHEIEDDERDYYKKVIQKIIVSVIVFAVCCSILKNTQFVSLVAVTMLIILCSACMGILKFKMGVKIR